MDTGSLRPTVVEGSLARLAENYRAIQAAVAPAAVMPIVMGGIFGDLIPIFLRHDLTLTASSIDKLKQIDQVAAGMGVTATVYLKIDTGMERIDGHYYSARGLLERAGDCARVRVEGISSHFAGALTPALVGVPAGALPLRLPGGRGTGGTAGPPGEGGRKGASAA